MIENIPKRRFKEFKNADAWEQRELNHVAERVIRKNKNLITDIPLTISASHGLVDQRIYFSKQVASSNLENYYLIKEGEFAYNKSYSLGNPVGIIKRLDDYSNGALSTLYIIFSLKPFINSVFINSYFKTTFWHKEIMKISSEGARNHGLLNVSTEEFFNQKLFIPTNIDEQSQIGGVIGKIEKTIILLQRKYDKLKQLQKSYLKEMLNAIPQRKPKRRFHGFTDDWEQRELGEIFKIIDGDRGKNYPNENDFYSSGHTLFLDTGNVQKSGFNFNNLKFINKEKDEMLKNGKLQVYDFILTSRGTLGNVAYYSPKIQAKYSSIRINSAMLILRPISRNSISDSLMTAILGGKIIEDFMSKNHVGSAQPHITKRDFSKLNVYLPSKYEEQEQLGMFILEVDKTITLLQHKRNTIEKLQKIYLQKHLREDAAYA